MGFRQSMEFWLRGGILILVVIVVVVVSSPHNFQTTRVH